LAEEEKTLFNSQMTAVKVCKFVWNQLHGFHNDSSDPTPETLWVYSDFEQCIINSAIN